MIYKQLLLLIVITIINISSSQLYEGDKCPWKETTGICTSITNCPPAIEALRNRFRPYTCGFNGIYPIVCCPSANRKSDEKCKYYERTNPKKNRIVGGKDAYKGEFPHMAALGYPSNGIILWQCGGSIISEKFILTAAHCLVDNKGVSVELVKVGIVNITDPQGRNYQVVKRIPHPEYNPPLVYNDLALLELGEVIAFTIFIKPACLRDPFQDKNPDVLVATGWGLTESGGDQSQILQKVSLNTFTEDECKRIYKPSQRRLTYGVQQDKQMCVGGRNADKDSCQGDSGGPLQSPNTNGVLFNVVGVTSFGKVCGVSNVPGVYTRVYYYVSWIEKNVWP